jgi:Ca2+-binding RTX toxin-like protein
MDGKDGSDIYIISGSGEHKAAEITDTGTSGTDEVRFSAAKAETLKIFAGDTGIERVVIGTGTGATADSSGTVSLHIDASKAVNGLTLIGNAGVNKLTGTAFADTIDGGAGADKLTGGAGDDTYIIDNVKDAISEKATGGTDEVKSSVGYKLASNVENLTLTGSANIGGTGNSAANTIVGNVGNNALFGGLGNDTLTGGAGADLFVFNTKLNAATNVDTITHFSSNDGDKVEFSLKLFKALGAVGDLTADQFWSGPGVTTAHDATDRLTYNTSTGELYYDADGTGTRAVTILVAQLAGNPTLAYGDILIIA